MRRIEGVPVELELLVDRVWLERIRVVAKSEGQSVEDWIVEQASAAALPKVGA